MKKTLTAVLVILLTLMGFKAMASEMDTNVLKRAKEINGSEHGGDNWETGNMKTKSSLSK
jgi:hypothetical protein